MMETEGEQIGLEWGQLLMQRVLKRFEETTGEKFKSYLKNAYSVQWLRCNLVLNAHVLTCTLRLKTTSTPCP